MTIKLRASFMIAALSMLPVLAIADVDDLHDDPTKQGWKLTKNDSRHSIKVYTKNEEGQKIRSFRVEATLDAPLEALLRVQTDVDNFSRWYFSSREIKLL